MGEKVLITGGTKGIGLETAKLFAENGYEVYVAARHESAEPVPGVQTILADLTKIQEISGIKEITGDVDILINNAGMDIRKSYKEYTEEDIERIVNLNIKAPVELIKQYSDGWIKRGRGRVVNVASQAAEIGHTDIWYGITKAGLVNATRSFASILGPEGVVVNAVAPGPVDTDFIKSSVFGPRLEKVRKRTILDKFAEPEDVAAVIYYLAADLPAYVNGEVFDINNGAQRI